MSSFSEAYKVPSLKKKLWFTFLIVSACVVLSLVPVPFLSHSGAASEVAKWGDTGVLMNVLSFGALGNGAVISLGIYPFLIASILMQILTIAVPKLRQMAMEGDAGAKKIGKYTRFVSLGMDVVFAVLFTVGMRGVLIDNFNIWVSAVIVAIVVAAGGALCGWFVELINDKGIGSGVSILIIASVIRAIPEYFIGLFTANEIATAAIWTAAVVVIGLVMIVFAVYVNSGEKKLRILFSKKTVGMKQYGMQNQVIPLRVAQAGIMPIIYAFCITLLPAAIVAMVTPGTENVISAGFVNFRTSILFYVAFAILLVGFTSFFSMIQFNPIDMANQIKQYGGYIQGIRPGKPTSQYMMNTYTNMNIADAAYLLVLCLVPMLLGLIPVLGPATYVGIVCVMLAGGLYETKLFLDQKVKEEADRVKQAGREAKKNKYAK